MSDESMIFDQTPSTPLVGCSQSFYNMSNDVGYGWSAGLSKTKWLAECAAMSALLHIAPEQHQGRFAQRYAARVFDNPCGGFVSERMIVWLVETDDHVKIVTTLHGKGEGGGFHFIQREAQDLHMSATLEADMRSLPKTDAAAWFHRTRWINQRVDELRREWWATHWRRLIA